MHCFRFVCVSVISHLKITASLSGVLAGLPDMTPSEEIYDGEELSDTMIVFCGLSNQKLDQALLALKKKRCGTVSVQSDLTPTNQHWLAKDCLAE